MIVVVSDTSPINYLVLCKVVEVRPALYERIVIPTSVRAELVSYDAPSAVRDWAKNPPAWLTVQPASNLDPSLPFDPGECEAICLALEIHADALIVDEVAAREFARGKGILVTGTVGILELAASKGLLDLSDVIGQLRLTNFHVSESLLQQALERDRRRRGIR